MKKLILILILLITACNTLKQDAKRLDKIDSRHPKLLAQKCDDKFISTDSVREVIKYIPGKTIVKTNTIRINIDSLIKTLPEKLGAERIGIDTQYLEFPCPPSIIRMDTILNNKTITSKQKANIYLSKQYADSMQLEVIKSQGRENIIQQKLTKRNRIVLILSSILLLLGILKIAKIYIKKSI